MAVILVLMAVCASAKPQGTTGKQPLWVTNGGDDRRNPPKGSLRAILHTAKPGDTIRFKNSLVVTLRDRLTVPSQLVGLRIEGPGGIAAQRSEIFQVFANGAVVNGVAFTRIGLEAGRSREGNDHIQITGCIFREGSYALCAGPDFTVSGNHFGLSTLRDHWPLDMDLADRSVVRENVIESKQDIAIAVGGKQLTINDNVVDGDIQGSVGSGTVNGNRLGGNELRLLISHGLERDLGHLDVAGNLDVGGILVTRGNVSIQGNTVSASSISSDESLITLATFRRHVGGGPSRITGNTITGGVLGIWVSSGPGALPIEISENTIANSVNQGIFAEGGALSVTHNHLSNCGRAPEESRGAGIFLKALFDENRIEGNDVTDCRRGIVIESPKKQPTVVVTNNMCLSSLVEGILVTRGRGLVVAEGNTLQQNLYGITYREASGTINGGQITSNTNAGIFIDRRSEVRISRVTMGGNGGVGIDLAPAGVTENSEHKLGNRNMDWPEDLSFDAQSGKLTGRSKPGAVIEVFAVEDGARAGNPKNGEGTDFLGSATAAADGRFTFPEDGEARCPSNKKLTVTATQAGEDPVTSEFSPDVSCEPAAATDRVSVTSQEQEASGNSQLTSSGVANRQVTADGRFVVFASAASNLVPNDTNNASDVFVRDREAGTTERVSVSSAGAQGTVARGSANSLDPSISEDGRWIAFTSFADNLVPGDANGNPDILLHDRLNHVTIPVTDPTLHNPPLPSGRQAHLGGTNASICGSGDFVAFVSVDTDWVPGDTNGSDDVFVWERSTGAIERVSVATGGAQGTGGVSGGGLNPRMTRDGRFVVFASALGALTDDTTPVRGQIYLRDRQNGTTELISKSTINDAASGLSLESSISDDGRFVAFSSSGGNLVPGDTNNNTDVFLRDRDAGTTVRVSVRPDGSAFSGASGSPSLSGDGSAVAFIGPGTHITSGGFTMLVSDAYLRDLTANTTEEVGVGPFGDADADCFTPSLGATSRFVAFVSRATNLTQTDTNKAFDVFLRDRGPK